MDVQQVETDVLVIGAGAAGLSAAVYAAQSGVNVLVLDKGLVGRSGSTVGAVQMAGSGKWSAPDDSMEAYIEDTLESGRGLSRPELVKILVEETEQRVSNLVDWGLKLDTDRSGNLMVYHTPGHRYWRGISAKRGRTGLGIMQTLVKRSKELPTLTRWNDVITLQLLKRDEQVVGAMVYDLVHKKVVQIQSKSVVLATGGIGQLYPITSNPVQATGDGFALALRVGASLTEMEQVQFYPVSLAYPYTVRGFCLSFYHLAKLYNASEERFMERYDPEKMEDVTRDRLANAIAAEVERGEGTPHQGVWLDATEVIERVKEEYPHEYDMCRKMGFDLKTDRVEVGPAAHFMMGGVITDGEGASQVPGLFVAGETSGGLHGGNRLVNNAITECVVFGARAGEAAAAYSAQAPSPTSFKAQLAPPFQALCDAPSGQYRPYQIKDRIKQTMSQYAGVRRREAGLQKAQELLSAIERDLREDVRIESTSRLSREVLDWVEAQHMILTAQAIVGSALQRKESRGAHYRVDFQESSPNIEHVVVNWQDEQLQFRKIDSLEEELSIG